MHKLCSVNGDNAARKIKSWILAGMPWIVIHSLKQYHFMVFWHLVAHVVSSFYGLLHLSTTLEYQTNILWATTRHKRSTLIRLMTHGPLPRNVRLNLLVQLTKKNSQKYMQYVYNKCFEGNSYFSLVAIEAMSGCSEELQAGLPTVPFKLPQLVRRTWLGATEGFEKFL